MRKYLIILLIAFCFVGCKANADFSVGKTEETVSYPKLKVENNKTNGEFIFLIELPNYYISPVEIRSGESMIFELNQGLWSYENVTVHIRYGMTRSHMNDIYPRVNFTDGETTTIKLGN